MVVIIVLSSVQLALNSPLNDPNGSLQRGLYWIDFFTTGLFFLESMLKIITFGFLFCGPFSYMRNIWNISDFFIMLFSLIAISPLAFQLQVMKMFRILRVLRLIGKDEGLKIGLQALFKAIPNVLRISVIMGIFFLIFGIISVSFFKGTYYYC
jgi:Ion transport protein